MALVLRAQFLLGFTAFFYPKYSKGARDTLLPYHQFLGRATFLLGLATMAVRARNCMLYILPSCGLPFAGAFLRKLLWSSARGGTAACAFAPTAGRTGS